MSFKKINSLKSHGDLFFDMHENGNKPTDTNYKEKICHWIKLNVFLSLELDCEEVKWLEQKINNFTIIAKKIWKQHRGLVTGTNVKIKHTGFFNKLFDITHISKCNCYKCQGKYKCSCF